MNELEDNMGFLSIEPEYFENKDGYEFPRWVGEAIVDGFQWKVIAERREKNGIIKLFFNDKVKKRIPDPFDV